MVLVVLMFLSDYTLKQHFPSALLLSEQNEGKLKRKIKAEGFQNNLWVFIFLCWVFWELIITCKKQLLHSVFISQLRCFIISWEQKKGCRASVSRGRNKGRFDFKTRFRKKENSSFLLLLLVYSSSCQPFILLCFHSFVFFNSARSPWLIWIQITVASVLKMSHGLSLDVFPCGNVHFCRPQICWNVIVNLRWPDWKNTLLM